MFFSKKNKKNVYYNNSKHHVHMMLDKALLDDIDRIARRKNKNRTETVSIILNNAVDQYHKYGFPEEELYDI